VREDIIAEVLGRLDQVGGQLAATFPNAVARIVSNSEILHFEKLYL
jgi:hypothetical protein